MLIELESFGQWVNPKGLSLFESYTRTFASYIFDLSPLFLSLSLPNTAKS